MSGELSEDSWGFEVLVRMMHYDWEWAGHGVIGYLLGL